jgi:hypothetical protein
MILCEFSFIKKFRIFFHYFISFVNHLIAMFYTRKMTIGAVNLKEILFMKKPTEFVRQKIIDVKLKEKEKIRHQWSQDSI